jgi:hypothetical protein
VVLRLLEVWKLCVSRSGTRPQDREVVCGVSGESGNNKRGHLRREGPEIVIGMVIAWSFRKGLRSWSHSHQQRKCALPLIWQRVKRVCLSTTALRIMIHDCTRISRTGTIQYTVCANKHKYFCNFPCSGAPHQHQYLNYLVGCTKIAPNTDSHMI